MLHLRDPEIRGGSSVNGEAPHRRLHSLRRRYRSGILERTFDKQELRPRLEISKTFIWSAGRRFERRCSCEGKIPLQERHPARCDRGCCRQPEQPASHCTAVYWQDRDSPGLRRLLINLDSDAEEGQKGLKSAIDLVKTIVELAEGKRNGDFWPSRCSWSSGLSGGLADPRHSCLGRSADKTDTREGDCSGDLPCLSRTRPGCCTNGSRRLRSGG